MIKGKLLLTGAKGQLGYTFSKLFGFSDLVDEYELQKVDIEEIDSLVLSQYIIPNLVLFSSTTYILFFSIFADFPLVLECPFMTLMILH